MDRMFESIDEENNQSVNLEVGDNLDTVVASVTENKDA